MNIQQNLKKQYTNNMEIKYKNYTLEPEGTTFNLHKEVTVNISTKPEKGKKSVPTGKTKTKKEIMGWGMSFERCVEHIIKDTMNSKKVTLTLRKYIDEYKALKTKILEETK